MLSERFRKTLNRAYKVLLIISRAYRYKELLSSLFSLFYFVIVINRVSTALLSSNKQPRRIYKASKAFG